MSAHPQSGLVYPSFLPGVSRRRNVWSALVLMLVCTLGLCTGVSAFAPGTGNPPGVPDLNNPLTKLTIIKNNSVADNSDQNIVKVHVVDNTGAPVAGVSVTFTAGSISVIVTTNASGDATFAYGSPTVGTSNINATIGGVAVKYGNPTSTNFIAGPPDVTAPTTTLSIVADNAIANGVNTNTVRATITDQYGHPLPGQVIVFTIASGTANFIGTNTLTTDASGNASIALISVVAGQVNITATVNAVNITNGSPATVTFVADVPSTTNPATALSVVTDNAVANNIATNSIKAHVVDANGNPVANAIITFTIIGGTATFNSPVTSTTDANGNVVIALKSKVAGSVAITATVNGTPIVNGSPVVVKFVADVPVTNKPGTLIYITNNNAVANGTATNRVKAQVVDVNGNPVAGATIVFTIVSGTGNFVGTATLTTDATGSAAIKINSTVAGNVTITATVNGAPIVNGSPVIVTFVADVPSTTNPATALSVVTDNAVANNIATNSIKAHVVDANGNPVANATIVFTIVSGTATFTSPVTATTDANGDVVIDLISKVAGSVSITATVNGTPIVNGSPVTVKFVADVPVVNKPGTQIYVTNNNAVANGTATDRVKVQVVDVNGNPVPNATIVFTIVSGTGTFVGTTTLTTDAAGSAAIKLTSTVAGNVSITATVNGVSIINGSPAIATFIADVPSTTNPATALSVVTDNALANGTATNSVKAHIVDANGNPVTNATIVFAIASGTGNFVGSTTITTDANGDAVIALTSTVAGSVNITATVNGVAIVNGSPATVIFKADIPNPTNPATALSVVINNALADGSDINSVKAHVVDANGNPVANQTVVFTIASGTGNIVGTGTVITNASGDAVILLNSTVAGNVTITATVGGVPIVNGSPATVTFVAGPIQPGNPATVLSVVSDNAAADGSATNSVKVHVADANGNAVPNSTIVFTIASGTASFVGSATVTTDANGDAVITLNSTVIGSVNITATADGIVVVNGSPATVHFVVGTPSVTNPATMLSVVTDNAIANGSATNSVKAHIEDVLGHPVPNATIVFAITSGTGTFIGTTTLTTDANGDVSIALNSTVAGKVNITATVNGTPIVNGSPAIVTFVPDAPSVANPATALIVVTNNAQSNGTATNSVKAHIADANGNPVPNATIVFSIANGTGTFVGSSTVTTDANGDAVITLTSTIGGTVDITATVNTVAIVNGSPATVTFTTDPDVTLPETELIVVANDAISDGIATNSVKAHVVDATGAALSQKEVFFKIDAGSATVLTVQPVLTDANGDAIILLSSTTPGIVSVTAKVADKPIIHGSPAKLRFVPIDIYVPRVFTPNNDGKNDEVKPILVGITTFHYFNIYNRWGNLVFSTKDPNTGWDGRFKGVLQPVETYLWIAEGLDKDKKKVTRRGMISLVR